MQRVRKGSYTLYQKLVLRTIQQQKYMTLDIDAADDEDDEIMQGDDQEEEKPRIHSTYKPLSIYPYQLLVSVDEPQSQAVHNLDAYFSISTSSSS